MYNFKAPIPIFLLVIGACCICVGQSSNGPKDDVIRLELSSRWVEEAHSAPIRNLLMIPNSNHLLSCSEDGTVCMWDTRTHQLIRRFFKEDQKVFCMTVTPDQTTLITGGTNNQIHSWELATGKHLQTFEQNRSVYAIDACPDNKSFLAGDDTGLTVHWDLANNKKLAEFTDGTDDITALKVAPDGKSFVTGDSSGTVRKWKLDGNDEPLDKLDGLSNWVCCLQFSHDQSELVGSDYSGNVGLWEYESGKTKWGKGSVASKISWVRFWDQDRVLAVSTTNELISMNQANGEFSKHEISTPSYCGFAFDTKKETVFTAGGSFISSWSTEDFKRKFPEQALVDRWGLKQWVAVSDRLVSLSHQNYLVIRDSNDLDVVAVINLNTEFNKSNLATIKLIPMGDRLVFFAKSKLCEVNLIENRLESFVDHKYSIACESPNRDRILVTDSRKRELQEIAPFDSTSPKTVLSLTRSFDRLELLNEQFLLLSGGGTHSPFMEIYSVGDNSLVSQAALEKMNSSN